MCSEMLLCVQRCCYGMPSISPHGREAEGAKLLWGPHLCTQPWGHIQLSLPCTSGSLSFCYLCTPLPANHFPAPLAGLFVLLEIHISNIWCLCGIFQRQSLENNPVPCQSQQSSCGGFQAKWGCGGLGEEKFCPQRSEEWIEYANEKKLMSLYSYQSFADFSPYQQSSD